MLEGHKQWGGRAAQGKGDSFIFRYGTYFTLLSLAIGYTLGEKIKTYGQTYIANL